MRMRKRKKRTEAVWAAGISGRHALVSKQLCSQGGVTAGRCGITLFGKQEREDGVRLPSSQSCARTLPTPSSPSLLHRSCNKADQAWTFKQNGKQANTSADSSGQPSGWRGRRCAHSRVPERRVGQGGITGVVVIHRVGTAMFLRRQKRGGLFFSLRLPSLRSINRLCLQCPRVSALPNQHFHSVGRSDAPTHQRPPQGAPL